MTALVILCVVALATAALYYRAELQDAERSFDAWRNLYYQEARACSDAEAIAGLAMRVGLRACETLRHKAAVSDAIRMTTQDENRDLRARLADTLDKLAEAIEGERVAREGREIAAAQAMALAKSVQDMQALREQDAITLEGKNEAIAALYEAAGTAEDKIRELTNERNCANVVGEVFAEENVILRAKIERLTKGRVKRPGKRKAA